MSNRERARKSKTIAESIRAASGVPPHSYAGKAADIMIVDDPHDETVMQPFELERLLGRADGDQVAVERFEGLSIETFEFSVDGVRMRCVARIGEINFEPRREARQAIEGRLTVEPTGRATPPELQEDRAVDWGDDLGLMGSSPISPNSGEFDQYEAGLTNNDGEVVKSTKKWSDSPTFSEKCQAWLIRAYRRLTRAGGGAGGNQPSQTGHSRARDPARDLAEKLGGVICPACGYMSAPDAQLCSRWRCGARL